MMSPGTSFSAATISTLPARRTRTVGELRRFRAINACSARYSCTNPRTALATTMARITAMSMYSLSSAPETSAATSST